MTTCRNGEARVYLAGHPAGESYHPGYRGEIRADVLGVHITPECEWLIQAGEGRGQWEPIYAHFDGTITVPWHRIDSIEWTGDNVTVRR